MDNQSESEEEAVELGVGQRIRAFVFERVLGSKCLKGASSSMGDPSNVTCRSCMTSRRAACVFAGARLISSANNRFVKTGPRRVTNSPDRMSYITWPTMSLGMRSGVNWILAQWPPNVLAKDRTRRVLPNPGSPSINTCPPANNPNNA